MDGTGLIEQERQRQIQQEGWTPEHDDEHTDNELAHAAAAYAMGGGLLRGIMRDREISIWPTGWGAEEDTVKNKPRLRQLVIAGALIVAEIERLQRASPEPVASIPAHWRCTACGDEFTADWVDGLGGHCRTGDDGHGNPEQVHCGPCEPIPADKCVKCGCDRGTYFTGLCSTQWCNCKCEFSVPVGEAEEHSRGHDNGSGVLLDLLLFINGDSITIPFEQVSAFRSLAVARAVTQHVNADKSLTIEAIDCIAHTPDERKQQ